MPLSRNQTAASLWREAVRDIQGNFTGIPHFEKFNLINRAVERIVHAFYALMQHAYLTSVIIVADTAGNFGVSGMSYVASTKRLTATMNSAFSAGDVGKIIMWRTGATVYIATISSFVSTTVVVVAGDSLPSSDIGTVDAVMMTDTTLAADTLSLSNLDIMRGGHEIKLYLTSTSTSTVTPVSLEELKTFRSAALQNAKKILFAYVGDELLMDKGDSISYGTLTLYYPRIPIPVASDTDVIDLPDGAPTSLAITQLKKLIAARIQAPMEQTAEIQQLVGAMFQAYGVGASLVEIKQKVEALS